MKLYVKSKGSGEVFEVIEYREPTYVKIKHNDWSDIVIVSLLDCDLCDEQGRLLKPEQPDLVRHLLETSKPIDPEIGNAVNEVFSEMESPEQPDMIPLEDALAFFEWTYNNQWLLCEDRGKWSYTTEDLTGLSNITTNELYDYWKENIKH